MELKDRMQVEKYLAFSFDYVWGRVLFKTSFIKMLVDEKLYLHSLKVSKLATQMAITAKLDDMTTRKICVAGLIHDIGKIDIPKEILYKKEPLTKEEFEIVKTHPVLGYNILSNVCEDEEICQMVLKHHEKINGSGYPNGLTKKSIPEEIITAADMFCAMVEPRVYHDERNFYEVYGFMCQSADLDPRVLQILSDSVLVEKL